MEASKKIFKDLLKRPNYLLFKPRVLVKMDKSNDIKYYPYHYRFGHTIEDCYSFRNWLMNFLLARTIVLSKDILSEQPSIRVGTNPREASNPIIDG